MSKTYTFAPTIGQFAMCDARTQWLFGPVGGGKTTGVLMKILALAHAQRANAQGRRKTRWAVVRNTKNQLKDSVIKSVHEWLPPNDRTIRWHATDLDLTLELPLADGTLVECTMMFRALDDERDAKRLLSVEYTGGWISEFREIPFTLMTDLLSRTGRYPPVNDGGADWWGVLGESNMCTKGSDWYNFLMVNRPDWCKVFIQPSALSPEAENRQFLKPDYYDVLLVGKSKSWIQAHVLSEFPDSAEGEAVWGESYDYERHVVDNLPLAMDLPILIGVDQGRSPAAVVGQMHGKTLNVLFSVHGSNMGMDRFVSEKLRPLALNHFPGHPIVVVIDPAGCRKSEVNDESPKDVLESAGYYVIPAPTNSIERRLDAVESVLNTHGGVRFSQSGAADLISAVASNYQFKKSKSGELAETPEKKHPWSDLADAFQYLCLLASGNYSAKINKRLRRSKTPKALPPPPVRGWT